MRIIVHLKFLFLAILFSSCSSYHMSCPYDECASTIVGGGAGKMMYYKRNIVDNENITNVEENYKSYDTSNYKRSYIKSIKTKEDNPNRNKTPVVKSYITHDKSKMVINDPETIEDFTNIKIDSAQEACLDLGLKENTEKFGECVLQLIE